MSLIILYGLVRMQLIESRVSTFESAIQLSSCLDILYTGVSPALKSAVLSFLCFMFDSCKPFEQVVDDEVDENGTTVPVVYEDKDESDEEESEDAMETDQDREDEEASDEAFDGVDDIEGSDGMTD